MWNDKLLFLLELILGKRVLGVKKKKLGGQGMSQFGRTRDMLGT
jgi:hypothetical protein